MFPRLEEKIDGVRESRTYTIVFPATKWKSLEKVHATLKSHSLVVLEYHQSKTESSISGTWQTIGSLPEHGKFVDLMMKDKDVKKFDY